MVAALNKMCEQQTLVAAAQNISRQYPANLLPNYEAAAQTLRAAYWDWASYPNLPPAVVPINVTINSPTGQISVRNPFYQYNFQQQPTGDGFGGALDSYGHTVRCPTSSLINNAALSDDSMDQFYPDFQSSVVSMSRLGS